MRKYIKVVIIALTLTALVSAGAIAASLGGLFSYSNSDNCIFTSDGKLYMYIASKSEINQIEAPDNCYYPSLSGDGQYVSVLSGAYTLDDVANYAITLYDIKEKQSITNAIDNEWVKKCDAILDAAWLGDNVIINCHLNPDNSLFTIVDPFTGKTSHEFSGALLKLIPQRNTYIYRATIAKLKDEQQHLYLGEKDIYMTEPNYSVYDIAVNPEGDKVCFFEVDNWGTEAYLVKADLLEDRIEKIDKIPISIDDVRSGLWYDQKGISLINGLEYSVFSEETKSFVYGDRLLSEEDEELPQRELKRFTDTLEKYGISSSNISYQIWY